MLLARTFLKSVHVEFDIVERDVEEERLLEVLRVAAVVREPCLLEREGLRGDLALEVRYLGLRDGVEGRGALCDGVCAGED